MVLRVPPIPALSGTVSSVVFISETSPLLEQLHDLLSQFTISDRTA